MLVMYQLVTVLLKLGQVAFSSAGSWWTLAETARSKLLANSASPEVALTLILDVHRAQAGKALRTTVGTSWSASSLHLAWDRVASAVCRGLSLPSGGLLPAVEALRVSAEWSAHTHDLDAAGGTVATSGAVVAQCAALKALAMLNSKTNAPMRQMVTMCVVDFPEHGRRSSVSSCSCASCCASPWATNVSACRSGRSTTMRGLLCCEVAPLVPLWTSTSGPHRSSVQGHSPRVTLRGP